MAGVTYTATLQGAEQVMRRFARIENATRKKIVRTAVREGLRPQLARAKATTLFKDRTRRLRRSLGISVRKGRQREQILGRVLTRKGGRHGIPLEFGHRIAVNQRTMLPERGYVLRRRDGRPKRADQSYGVSFGFVEPRPFLQEAFRATVSVAERRFTERFVSDVYREAAANG